jgi:hypothetical protein
MCCVVQEVCALKREAHTLTSCLAVEREQLAALRSDSAEAEAALLR